MSKQTFQIAVLSGDGIGPEVTQQAVRLMSAACEPFEDIDLSLQEVSVGAQEYLKNGDPLPDSAFDVCRESDAVLLGAMGMPSVRWPDGREMTPQIDLRERLDLYNGLRPIYLYAAEDSPLKKYQAGEIDFVIVRENTEGLFAARTDPQDQTREEARDIMLITRKGSLRIFRAAFDQAMQRRKKVTLVDKANVLPSMVLFREVFEEIAAEYPEVETEVVYVDAAALFLVQRPQSFDVIVTENMFGDILSDLAAGLVGGMGMAPSGDIGEDCAVFQPSHGTAPDIAGQNKANPVATILSAAMLLQWLDHPSAKEAGVKLDSAVKKALADPAVRTGDVGGSLSTTEMGDAILKCL
ncbi:isocitrate/isopropylmalate dehydrogenase family protein [Mariniblastus fucicola]|uniref:3-isopropylmalate dehydrogenase n=1 Tax=Mariniblastus fucicola TaxID=980251 RepID=A0A5B9PI49_9BACT|nr:isocitrate/isopropylmalate dehydrogenase family protein [Mariniblastus fucicola]QEG24352.1 3-isopropylmalate dehydrogenase [Mariniblastus fucicola]